MTQFREEAAKALTKLGGSWNFTPRTSGKTPLAVVEQALARVAAAARAEAASVASVWECHRGCGEAIAKMIAREIED